MGRFFNKYQILFPFFQLLFFIGKVEGKIVGDSLVASSVKIDSAKLHYCMCDSIIDPGMIISDSSFIKNAGTGLFRGYRTEDRYKQISDRRFVNCGYYLNFRLISGLWFVYDAEDNLVEIKEIYLGKQISSCKIQ